MSFPFSGFVFFQAVSLPSQQTETSLTYLLADYLFTIPVKKTDPLPKKTL
jgi:hypothetical protein